MCNMSPLFVLVIVFSIDDKIRIVRGVIQDGGPLGTYYLWISLLSVKKKKER